MYLADHNGKSAMWQYLQRRQHSSVVAAAGTNQRRRRGQHMQDTILSKMSRYAGSGMLQVRCSLVGTPTLHMRDACLCQRA